jgi:hypothetical protein
MSPVQSVKVIFSVNQYLLLYFSALLLVLGGGTSDMTGFLIEYIFFSVARQPYSGIYHFIFRVSRLHTIWVTHTVGVHLNKWSVHFRGCYLHNTRHETNNHSLIGIQTRNLGIYSLKVTVFCDVTLCNVIRTYQWFRWVCCPHFQGIMKLWNAVTHLPN